MPSRGIPPVVKTAPSASPVFRQELICWKRTAAGSAPHRFAGGFGSGDQRLDVNLSVAAVQTDVTVTASTTPLAMTEVAKALDIVDSEQIELRDVFQITEALRALPGIQIQTLEGPGSLTRIRTRGLRSADTAVLIDGMRFRNAGPAKRRGAAFSRTW